LNAKKTIRKLQIEILNAFLGKYGIEILNHLEEMRLELLHQQHKLLLFFRDKNKASLAATNHMIHANKIVQLTELDRVKLHKEFSNSVAEEFKEMSLRIVFLRSSFKSCF